MITNPWAAAARRTLRTAVLCTGLASVAFIDAAHAGWQSAGNFTTGRYQHTATQLPDGRVLVVGGRTVNNPIATTRLYDPADGHWVDGPNLPVNAGSSRTEHTATLLGNGNVLIAGGSNGNVSLRTALLYDTELGDFSIDGNMASARQAHTATLLPDGRVLMVGGRSYDSAGYISTLASAEIYEPVSHTWESTGPLATARHGHTATLLTDGRVLVVGGWGDPLTPLASVEIWNPATGQWSTAASLPAARTRHTATLIPSGQVFVAGGATAGINPLASTLLYDPVGNAWVLSTTLRAARDYHSATLLADGRVLIAGGRDAGGAALAATEAFDPATGLSADMGALVQARYVATSVPLHNGELLLTGGLANTTTELNSAERLQLGAGAPDAPTNASAIPGDGQVAVAWQAPTTGTPPTSYAVSASPGGASCTVQAPVTHCVVTGLTNGTAYTFTVTANTVGGSASAPPTSSVTPRAPTEVRTAGAPVLSGWGALLLAALMGFLGVHMRRFV